MRKTRTWIPIAIMVVPALVACGGGKGNDDTSTDSVEDQDSATDSDLDTAGDPVPDTIEEDVALDDAGADADAVDDDVADSGDAPSDEGDADAAEDATGDEIEADGPPPPPTCAAPEELDATHMTVASATESGMGVLEPVEGDCYGAEGQEAVYSFVLDHAADLIWTVEADFDSVAYIRADCDGIDAGGAPITDDHCVDEYTFEPEVAEWLDAPAGTYYLIVDGYADDEYGAYAATLTVREVVGLGDACNDLARCGDGLSCLAGLCATDADYCAGTAFDLTVGVETTGDTSAGAVDDTTCDGDGGEADDLWTFVADATGGTYSVLVTSPDTYYYDPYIYAIADCTDTSTASICTESDEYGAATFDMVLGPGERGFVVADCEYGYEGAYTIRVDEVTFLGSGASCDPAATRTVRCPDGEVCDAGTSLCRTIADICADGAVDVLEDGIPRTGDTTGLSDLLQCSYSGSAGDEYWMHDPAATGTVAVTVRSLDDHVVFLYRTSDCLDPEASDLCTGGGGKFATMDMDVVAGEAVMLVVDGYYGEEGAYEIEAIPVTMLSSGDACDPGNPLGDRCPAGEFCDASDGSGNCGPIPASAESEPNDAAAAADPFVAPALISGALAAGDSDFFAVPVPAGAVVVAELHDGATSTCAGYEIDSTMNLYDPAGGFMATDSGGGEAWCSLLTEIASVAGVHFIEVRGYASDDAFDYTLSIDVIP